MARDGNAKKKNFTTNVAHRLVEQDDEGAADAAVGAATVQVPRIGRPARLLLLRRHLFFGCSIIDTNRVVPCYHVPY